MTDGSEVLAWKAPPAPRPSRAERVANELRSNPGEWALIHHAEGLGLMSWWAPIASDPDFEIRIVPTTDKQFGPRDIYARFTTPASA